MAIDLDRHAGLDSPIHRLEARCRLIGLASLMAGFAVVHDPILIVPVLALAAAVVLVSRIPPAFIAARVRAPLAFVTALGLLLPLVGTGPVVASLGPLAIHGDGLWRFAVILAKVLAIAATALVLFGTAPLPVTVVAMQRLGLPPVMADMTLFSYRAIRELGTDLETMRTAAGLRGLRWRGRPPGAPSGIAVLASLVGSLFVTSHARAMATHRAMMLRGYSGARALAPAAAPGPGSLAFAAVCGLTAMALAGLEFALGRGA